MSDTKDVTSTLAELERKLRELEHELGSIGQRRSEPATSAAVPGPAAGGATAAPTSAVPAGRLVDEEVEYERIPAAAHARPAERAEPAERAAPSDAQLESLADLRRFRDRLERFAKELTEDYDALLGRVMSSLSGRPVPPEQPRAGLAAEPASARAAEPPAPREETLFEGRVELGVGPFYDIASLSGFERQLAELPYVGEVSVRRFEASHAVVDLRLSAPVTLVSELRRLLGAEIGVREVGSGRILLTFDDA